MRVCCMVVVLCIACLLVSSSGSSGAPSFRGYTGLVRVPTADVVGEREYNAGLMTEDADEFEAGDVFANYGAATGLEVGINSFRARRSADRETLIHAKYSLFSESTERAALAAGLIDVTSETTTTAYVVASKSLARAVRVFESDISFRGHIGVGGGQLDGMFGGVSVAAGNRVSLSAEWDSRDVHLGFVLMPVRGVRLHAAWLDVGGKGEVGLGVSFSSSY